MDRNEQIVLKSEQILSNDKLTNDRYYQYQYKKLNEEGDTANAEKKNLILSKLRYSKYFKGTFCSESKILAETNVELTKHGKNIEGVLYLTDIRLIFIPKNENLLNKIDNFIIPLSTINSNHKNKTQPQQKLEIETKDNKSLEFIISESNYIIFVHNLISCLPKEGKDIYNIAQRIHKINQNIDGWKIYDAEKEFKRQKLDLDTKSCQFRRIDNSNFEVCETYPKVFLIPKNFTDSDLRESRKFRTKNRVPAFCWIHPEFKTTIWRSSQTKQGITLQRSPKDELLLKLIRGNCEELVIYDARPYLNALANRLKGAGFENINNYEKTEIIFCEIDNIHSIRHSLQKVYSISREVKLNDRKKFFTEIENSCWLDYIYLIIKFSFEICETLEIKKKSVLIHCSDGWDRSSQLVSLSQLIIDPYFRTIEGFIVLIEKDWLSFGHQFALRNGIYVKNHHDEESSPIFLQWLDCVHQLLLKYPTHFEFNQELLLFLAYHSQSAIYGTFIYNNEKERNEMKGKTFSIWNDVIEEKSFKNCYYNEQRSKIKMDMNFSLIKLRIWEEYFLQWNYTYQMSFEKKIYHFEDQVLMNNQQFYSLNMNKDEILMQNQEDDIKKLNKLIKELIKYSAGTATINYLSNEMKKEIQCIEDNKENNYDNHTI